MVLVAPVALFPIRVRCGILVPWPGMEVHPLPWKVGSSPLHHQEVAPMPLLCDTLNWHSGHVVLTRDPSHGFFFFFFFKNDNNIEAKVLLETLCCVWLRLHFNKAYQKFSTSGYIGIPIWGWCYWVLRKFSISKTSVNLHEWLTCKSFLPSNGTL